MEFTKSDKVSVVPHQISCALGSETVVLQLQSGTYYGLNEVGRRVWELIAEPRTVGEICAVITREFEVEPERCERDVVALLNDLRGNGLIAITSEAA